MIKTEVQVKNEFGLHLRPAGKLADAAIKYKSEIQLKYHGKSVNGKSLLSVLSLGIKGGYIIEVECDGEDEEDAMKAVLKVIEEQ